ncbi:MAG TPA: retropepsin-like aspartic protease [Gemmatimonadota bacterium]|nr:retropepsin-like aspartic protease [Gemmatimonadota bacterium]
MRKQHEWVVLPLERSPLGLLYVSGAINGSPITLLIDTGANATLLDRVWVARHSLVGEPTELGTIGCVTVNGIDMVDVDCLELGAIRVEGIRLAVVDLSQVNRQLEQSASPAVGGILGADVLTERAAVIDYSDPRLQLLGVG